MSTGGTVFQAGGTLGAKTMRWDYSDRLKEQVKVLYLKGRVDKEEVGEALQGQTSC